MVITPHEEEDKLRRPQQRFAELLAHQVVIAGREGVDGSGQADAIQGRGRLIDLEWMLQGNGGVGEDKNDEEDGERVTASKKSKLPPPLYLFTAAGAAVVVNNNRVPIFYFLK